MLTAGLRLVDSHCHLDFPDLAADRNGLLARAAEAGVERMVTISTRVARFDEVLEIAEAHKAVNCTVGTHPHHAGEAAEKRVEVGQLVELSRHPRVVGIGECGLDYYYDKSPREDQEEGFRRHIRACLETGLPLIVHSRDAEADTMRVIREEAAGGGLTGVMHCFSSGPQLAEEALEFGFHISFSGIVTFKNSTELREICGRVPMDRLLVETDAPYLAPVPKRGKTNEPAFVAHTAKVVADVKGVAAEELAAATTANFYRLFAKAAA